MTLSAELQRCHRHPQKSDDFSGDPDVVGSPRGLTAADNSRPVGADYHLRLGLRPRQLRLSARCSLPFENGSRMASLNFLTVTAVTLVTV